MKKEAKNIYSTLVMCSKCHRTIVEEEAIYYDTATKPVCISCDNETFIENEIKEYARYDKM